jgi:hypothetical protein
MGGVTPTSKVCFLFFIYSFNHTRSEALQASLARDPPSNPKPEAQKYYYFVGYRIIPYIPRSGTVTSPVAQSLRHCAVYTEFYGIFGWQEGLEANPPDLPYIQILNPPDTTPDAPPDTSPDMSGILPTTLITMQPPPKTS